MIKQALTPNPTAGKTGQPHPSVQEIVLPDFCNLGVVVRVLLFVNVLVLMSVLARGNGFAQDFSEFMAISMLVELICLSSLVTLCGFRRLLERQSAARWMQRMVSGAVPAMICFLFLVTLLDIDWFAYSFPRLHPGYASLLCFVIGIFVQHYFELRTKAFSPALGEARLQALQARIRPHFLFNSLNAVLSLIRSEPRRAETALEDLADLFRVLMRDTRELSTLTDEISLCQQYLAIEKIRLGERLQVNWQVQHLNEKELSQTQIPALLLQPLLENAVHYGVEPVARPSLILIEIQKSLDKIEIKVTNDYHPSAQLAPGNHMALENIRQRLRLLYDIEAQLQAEPVDARFVVTLLFPQNQD
ncbi:MAG: histidine kinase [Burkholderiales bacterium]|nr:histidine kinase [Burkholderiales bacterium]